MQSILAEEVIVEDVGVIGDFKNLARRLERRDANIDKYQRAAFCPRLNLRLLNGSTNAAIMGGLGRVRLSRGA